MIADLIRIPSDSQCIACLFACLALGSPALAQHSIEGNGWISPTADFSQAVGGGSPPEETMGNIEYVIDVDISNRNTWDIQWDPSNEVMIVNVATLMGGINGTPVYITGIGWNTNQVAHGTSWLSEMRMYIDDAFVPDGTGLYIRPSLDNVPGSGSFSSGGLIDLTVSNLPYLFLPTGRVRIEFYESFDDYFNMIDGTFNPGSTLQFETMWLPPAPGAGWLLVVAAVAGKSRRRGPPAVKARSIGMRRSH